MDGRTLERIANFGLLFCALVLPALVWAMTSHLGTATLPWAVAPLLTTYMIFLTAVCGLYYPVIKIVEGVQVANYSRACADLDDLEKELSK